MRMLPNLRCFLLIIPYPLKRLANTFFGNGWSFVLLPLGVYLLAWQLRVDVQDLRPYFLGLSLLLLGFFAIFLGELFSKCSRRELIFWTALVLFVFFLPGTYLEFPADNWEHFRRILSWQTTTLIDEHELRGKFSYFWAWSWISAFPLAYQRGALDFLNTAQQLFVVVPIYFLANRFFATRVQALTGTLVFIFSWGTSIFGLRYYGISSSPLAYGAFLHAVVLLLDYVQGRAKGLFQTLLRISGLLGIMYFNHLQEVLLFTLMLGGMPLIWVYQRISEKFQRRFLGTLLCVLLLSLSIGPVLRHHLPELLSNAESSLLGGFAHLDISNPSSRYFSTLGIHGLVALGLSLIFFRRLFPLSFLTLLPTFVLLCPLSFVALASVLPNKAPFYRLLYAFPTCFALYAGLLIAAESFNLKNSLRQTFAIICIALLLLPSGAPWFGRLRFAFHQPTAVRTLAGLENTAAWFRANRKLDDRCYFMADSPTSFALISYLGRDMYVDRLRPSLETKRFSNPDRIADLVMSSQRQACGILLIDDEKLPPAGDSWAAETARHWKSQLGDPRWYFSPAFSEAVNDLLAKNYSKTFVPPHYWYFEPPRQK